METKNKILHTYDRKGNLFKKVFKINNEYTDLIKKNLTKNSLVLELGCGGGRLTLSINDYAKKVIGIDFSKELIKQAKANAKKPNIEYKVMDGEKIRFDSETFDMVVSHAVINKKMCRADLAFKGTCFVLKPRGKLVVKMIYSTWGKEFKFKGGYNKEEIVKILSKIGFKKIKVTVKKQMFQADSYDKVKWIKDTEAPHLSPKKAFEDFFKKSEINGKYVFDDSFMIVYAEKGG